MTSEEHGERLRKYLDECFHALDTMEFKFSTNPTVPFLCAKESEDDGSMRYNIYAWNDIPGIESASGNMFHNSLNFKTESVNFNSTHGKWRDNTYFHIPMCTSEEDVFQQSTAYDLLGLQYEDFVRLNTLRERLREMIKILRS